MAKRKRPRNKSWSQKSHDLVCLQVRRGYYISEPSGDERCIPFDLLPMVVASRYELRKVEIAERVAAEHEPKKQKVLPFGLALNDVPHQRRTDQEIAGVNHWLHFVILRIQ